MENRDPSFLLAALCRVVPAAHATVVFDGRLSVNLGFKVLSSEEIPSKFPCPIPTLILLENESNFSCRKNYRHTRTYRTKALLVTVQRSTMVKPAEVISSSISTQVIMTSFLVIRLEEAMIAFCWVWVTWENKP